MVQMCVVVVVMYFGVDYVMGYVVMFIDIVVGFGKVGLVVMVFEFGIVVEKLCVVVDVVVMFWFFGKVWM